MGRSGADCGCSGTLCIGSGRNGKVVADAVFDDGVAHFIYGCLVLDAKRVDLRKRICGRMLSGGGIPYP
eukprot:13669536-Ditylum_brightwellii.AAC.1